MWSMVVASMLALTEAAVAWRSWDAARRIARVPVAGQRPAGTVTVVVPARNEAANIAACVQSVLIQDGVQVNLLVADDASEDGTAQVAQVAGAEVLRLSGPPPGWAVKNYALARGATGATSDWLAFLDADTRLGAGALAALVAFAEAQKLDSLSLGASQSAKSVVWPLVTPVGLQLILSQAAPDGVGQSKALAVGQFILVRRNVYERVGGHTAIRASRADDIDLATLVRDNGGRTQFAWGDDLLTSAQSATWGDLWASWRKSFHAGTGGSVPALLLGGLTFVVWGAAPLALLFSRHRTTRGLALLSLGIGAAGRRSLERHMRVSTLYAPTLPLARTLLGCMMLDAAAKAAARRPSQWKGREVKDA